MNLARLDLMIRTLRKTVYTKLVEWSRQLTQATLSKISVALGPAPDVTTGNGLPGMDYPEWTTGNGRNINEIPWIRIGVELFTRPFLPLPFLTPPTRKGLGTKLGMELTTATYYYAFAFSY